MSKSLLTIHKEIEKKEYAKSPLGLIEKELGNFYAELKKFGTTLPEDVAKQIYDIRDENEKAQIKYIEDSQRRDREYVDNLLLEAMTKEMTILNKYKNDN